MSLRALLLPAFFALAACAAPQSVSERRATVALSELPPMRTFAPAGTARAHRSNIDIAQDFLDLSFTLESGRSLPILTRFEDPVSVRVTGQRPASLDVDLDRLLGRLRREARIDISRVAPGSEANITIEMVPRARLQKAVPQAACFVVPRVSSWREFARNRRSETIDWATLETRERLAIFIPGDVPPQEVRDCLHEELAQALGPLNDLYRLTDSVFNDDNFHTVLTGFDMLILRATYSDALHSGMTRDEVAAALPGLLSRLNPSGNRIAAPPRAMTSRAWIDAIEQALGPNVRMSQRRENARRAVALARAAGWNDNRLAFSLFALGRLSISADPDVALMSFLEAGGIYGTDRDTSVHGAHIAMQLATFALSAGQPHSALAIVDANTQAVIEAENASLLSTLLLVKAEAMRSLGRPGEADRLRDEALGWARYGYGDTAEILSRADEIAAIAPKPETAS
ncbi:DUF2927 domain-containing protein [Palleronia marisminoris]|nr:DUF2927 domain-containing protein [Palleronia marisminoris]